MKWERHHVVHRDNREIRTNRDGLLSCIRAPEDYRDVMAEVCDGRAELDNIDLA